LPTSKIGKRSQRVTQQLLAVRWVGGRWQMANVGVVGGVRGEWVANWQTLLIVIYVASVACVVPRFCFNAHPATTRTASNCLGS